MWAMVVWDIQCELNVTLNSIAIKDPFFIVMWCGETKKPDNHSIVRFKSLCHFSVICSLRYL